MGISLPCCLHINRRNRRIKCKKLVLFGCCGVLDEEAADEIEADKTSVDKLVRCLEICGYSYIKGKTWTTGDGIFSSIVFLRKF